MSLSSSTAGEIEENLCDAGCTADEKYAILACLEAGEYRNAESLIGACRSKHLENLHESQKCIDRLDYLLWRMNHDHP